MSINASELVRAFAERGLRVTPQRRAVLEVVAAADVGVNPLQVYEAARRGCPEIGLTTVYRTLDILAEAGVLRRVHDGAHCESFATAQAAHGHSVVCRRCGRVAEFTACDMGQVVAAASRETGFVIDDHFLQLTGECAQCAASSPPVSLETETVALRPRQGKQGLP